MRTHDSLDRALPNHIIPVDHPITITDTDVWGTLEPLSIHGPLFTCDLEAFASFYKDNGLAARKRISWLSRSTNIRYHGEIGRPVLTRPRSQFPEDPRRTSRMMLAYDLSDRGVAILKDAGRYHDIAHGGWWKHQMANSHISAGIHIGALFDKEPFTPRDRIAAELGVTVPYYAPDGTHYDNHRLVPDNLFRVGKWRRYHALETDLGNEQARITDKTRHRKTLERMILQYAEFVTKRLYLKAYGIPTECALTPLFVTTKLETFALMQKLLMEFTAGRGCGWFWMQHIPSEAFSAYHSPKPLHEQLWSGPWKRAGRPDAYINKPEKQ